MTDKKLVFEWIERLQADPTNVQAQENVVAHYKGLVESLAFKYASSRLIHEELVQVGMIGLFAAVQRFDKTYGKSFEAFAIPTILGEIKRFIRDQTWSVHVPRRIKELGPRIQRATDELVSKMQRSPSIKEIADYLKVSETDVLETLEMRQNYRALSADRQVDADGEGGTMSIFDVKGKKDTRFSRIDLRLLLEEIFSVLSIREKTIIECVYFEEMSQKDTGKLLGISQMHVSRIQRKALMKMKASLPMSSEEVFDDY